MTRKRTQAEATFLIVFGQRVRECREALGLSQEQLGKRADLHRTYVGAVERGSANLGLVNLTRIAHALETDVGELLAGLTFDPFEPG